MRPGAETGAAAVRDDLSLGNLLVAADGDARVVAVERDQAVVVVDHHEVAVAGHPAAPDDRAAVRGVDGGAARDADVEARVERPPAHPERARDRAGDRPDEDAAPR